TRFAGTPAQSQDPSALSQLGTMAHVDIAPIQKQISKLQEEVCFDYNPYQLFQITVSTLSGGQEHILHVRDDQFGQLYMLSGTLEKGTGEKGVFSSQVLNWLDGFVWYFQKAEGDKIYFVRKNTKFITDPGTPTQKTVEHSFGDSVLATLSVVSKDTTTHTTMIKLADIPFHDLLEIGNYLKEGYPAAFLKESSLEGVKAYPQNVEIRANLLYGNGSDSNASSTLADARGFSLILRYSISALPDSTGFKPRPADQRIGYFTVSQQDWSKKSENKPSPHVSWIARWNLQKVDPVAPVSEVKNPIVFWLEETIPLEYRDALRAGILAWNAAFEAIGFRNVIVVKEQDKDLAPEQKASFDPADVSYNMVRWVLGNAIPFGAVGPPRVNPATGQIYNATVSINAWVTRLVSVALELNSKEGSPSSSSDPKKGAWCDYAQKSFEQAAWTLSLLETRNQITPQEKQKFINDYLTHIMSHEIGHNLGLTHNFKASTLYPLSQLNTPQNEGVLAASVMDYLPVNIAPEGAPQGPYFQTKLGPYDFWAIEYGYKNLGAATSEEESLELNQVASQAGKPGLVYGEDLDDVMHMDPDASWFDLGQDPVAYSRSRVELVRELWKNLETKVPQPEEGYGAMRRSFQLGMRQYQRAVDTALKVIGGIYVSRSLPGDPAGKPPYEPVPAQKQKEALEFLERYLFSQDAFKFSPKLLQKLGQDRSGLSEEFPPIAYGPYSVDKYANAMREQALAYLYQLVADRLTQSKNLASTPSQVLSVGELFSRMRKSIWSEISGRVRPGNVLTIDSTRMDLQSLHLNRLEENLNDSSAAQPAALARESLLHILQDTRQELKLGNLDSTTRVYLKSVQARIQKILKGEQSGGGTIKLQLSR
ncbi:MAG: zinc-dependent metalloprotease, partial [Elusimicrobia bacterium]|nr:zinc-dependent metalloprotease [Elusimicrobiota bacterium]